MARIKATRRLKGLLLLSLLAVSFCVLLRAQTANVFPSYYAKKDAELSADPACVFWKDVPGLVIERSILGDPEPELRSEVRSRWTRKHLYLLFSGTYDKLNLKPNPRTDAETFRLWEFDVFELYLGADFEHINHYGEFQVSPQGEFLDLAIDSTKPRPGWSDERLWDSGMKVKARVDAGTHIWYAEMRIPIASVSKERPEFGSEFRVNIYRLHGPGPKRHFLAWQTIGIWNPHHPEEFGRLRLVSFLPKN